VPINKKGRGRDLIQQSTYDRYSYEIRDLLREKNYSFTELEKVTNFSSRTLSKHLKKMINDKEIIKLFSESGKPVYSMTIDTIINYFILPELMAFLGADTTARILHAKIKGEKGVDFIQATYITDKIYEIFVTEKYCNREISADRILDVLKKNPEYMKHIRLFEELGSKLMEGIKYKVQYLTPLGLTQSYGYAESEEQLEFLGKYANEHGAKLLVTKL